VRLRDISGLLQDKMKRTRFLVCYDISHPKRLRQVAKILEGYGNRLQFSVFECPLDKQRLAELKSELLGIVHHEEDQILFVSLGQETSDDNVVIEALGLAYIGRTRLTII